ncbi:protein DETOXIFICATION 17-like [Syzygium oleosum]|uniref:protein DETOXIFICATION 17-like n=1 Tax=Syzygium oleosum TaxID=219896 RepID=UPI0024BADDFB|nr:protein DETOXIFICATION 17-like [Syzygium oleosum]
MGGRGGGGGGDQEIDEASLLESPLIQSHDLERDGGGGGGKPSPGSVPRDERRVIMIEELKRQVRLSGPLIGVSMLQYSVQVISVMFVGHLGELPLSGASMATSFASVTGFSVLLGMGSALETLCGQAYGAKEYHMLGVTRNELCLRFYA